MTKIYLSQDDQWENIGNTWFRGDGFIDEEYYDAERSAVELDRYDSITDRLEFLRRFNGFFAVLSRINGTLLLSIDHAGSIPLYYSVNEDIFVSDTSGWVDEHTLGGHDPYAATECLHTMFVTGPETIGEATKQVQAGEYVLLDTEESEINDRGRHQLLDLGSGASSYDKDSFDTVLQNVADRLVTYANGRTICVALSGGSDSRLIALLLARTGYDNVITYTHDLPSGSPNDIPTARAISKDVGFEHITLNLTHEDYRHFYSSNRWCEFSDTVDLLASVPNIHETVVLEKLKEEANLSNNPIDIRGHLPIPHGRDAFLPAVLEQKPLITRREFFDFIWNGHYIRWKASTQPKQWKTYFTHRALKQLPMDIFDDSLVEESGDVAAALSQWYCQERAAKYVSFDLEYDFAGFDRWLPLWDLEYVELLQDLKLSQLISKKAHNRYVDSISNNLLGYGVEFNPATTASQSVSEKIKFQFWHTAKESVNTLPNQIEYPVKNVGRSVLWEFTRGYDSDPRYGLVGENRFNQFDLDKYDAETFYYLLLFQDGAFDLPDWVELNDVT